MKAFEGHSWGSTKFWGSLIFAALGAQCAKAGILNDTLTTYLMVIYFLMVTGNVGIKLVEQLLLRKNDASSK